MKKILLLVLLVATVFSCKKQEITPQTPAPLDTDSIKGQQEQILLLNNKLPH